MSQSLRLGTRGSMLARTQSGQIADAIEKANPGTVVELIIIKTTGDQVQDRPLAELGGKGLFTKEIEQALLRDEIDLAVHSYKDVPVTMPLVDVSELVIAAVPPREDARDVLVAGEEVTLDSLPQEARIGTGSLRRRAQLLSIRPDLQMLPLRGNIDTRLKKRAAGEYDAIVLAAAGLLRAGLFDREFMTSLPPYVMTPAAGQGALALQCRADDARTRDAVAPLHDAIAAMCVDAERAIVAALEADCHSPIGVHAIPGEGRRMTVHVFYGLEEAWRMTGEITAATVGDFAVRVASELNARRGK